jgi:RNA polymerase sigma-70 factor, ECF subfamily
MRAICTQHITQNSNNDLTSQPDESLVGQAISQLPGAEAAFAVLVARYHPWIYRRCLFRLGNHHDAEDATQDIVLRIHDCLHQFQGRSLFKSWLNTIVRNYCVTFAMRRSRYITDEDIDTLLDSDSPKKPDDPVDALANEELVKQTISSLPDNARQVINLRFFAGFSLEEIASSLDLTLSAAKARLYRAIELLKQFYVLLLDAGAVTYQK